MLIKIICRLWNAESDKIMLTFSDSFPKATEAIDVKTTNWNSSKFIACHMSGYVTSEPPSADSMQSGAGQESNSVIVRRFRLLLNNNGQNRRKAMCNKTKKTNWGTLDGYEV